MIEFAHSTTQSTCPECRRKVPAQVVERDGAVYLDKWCPDHGSDSVLVSSDASWFRESVHHVKPRQVPLELQVEGFRGCPESCGFCSEHRQHTCLPVIEILRDCDLRCPVCLKGEVSDDRMDLATFGKVLDTLVAAEGAVPVVNLSGGEPTLHPDLPAFLALARAKG
ncbi:MAG TPA: radical SAM protein, partial [Fibrobacteria bacterium]|nr:radical SAM protein [Fibrobacteria bacterium]